MSAIHLPSLPHILNENLLMCIFTILPSWFFSQKSSKHQHEISAKTVVRVLDMRQETTFFQGVYWNWGQKEKHIALKSFLQFSTFRWLKQDLNTMPGPDPWARHALTTCRKPGWIACIMSYFHNEKFSFKCSYTHEGEDAYQIRGSEMSGEKTITV